jgi:hypothetical protein
MFKWLTKGYTRVPLFWVEFNLQKYNQHGTEGSCVAKIHPTLKEDDYVRVTLEQVIDYIRENYDMKKLSK